MANGMRRRPGMGAFLFMLAHYSRFFEVWHKGQQQYDGD
jgi:uncharacterized protein YfbU (UPF0304 family)